MRAIWRQENKGKNVSLGRKGQWPHELLIFQDSGIGSAWNGPAGPSRLIGVWYVPGLV